MKNHTKSSTSETNILEARLFPNDKYDLFLLSGVGGQTS